MRQFLRQLATFFSSKSSPVAGLNALLAPPSPFEAWWKNYQVPLGTTRTWCVGRIEIGVKHLAAEWQIAAWKNKRNPFSHSHNLPEVLPRFPEKLISYKSFSASSLGTELNLKPILADKPLASRLAEPFYIPPGEEAMLYVSSPIWVQITASLPSSLIEEIPTHNMSETWYGPNTMEGELCYAGYTYCSSRLEELPRKSDRIITPIRIRNLSRSTLLLDKAIIPLPYLSIFVDDYNQLWTEQLVVKRENENYPEVKLNKGPPKLINNAKLLSPPRLEIMPGTGLKNLFNALIRK